MPPVNGRASRDLLPSWEKNDPTRNIRWVMKLARKAWMVQSTGLDRQITVKSKKAVDCGAQLVYPWQIMNNNDLGYPYKSLNNDRKDPLKQPGPNGLSDEPVWRDHIIVMLQTLGFSVAEQLEGVGLQVVAIEANSNHNLAGQAERLQISLIEGEARARPFCCKAASTGPPYDYLGEK